MYWSNSLITSKSLTRVHRLILYIICSKSVEYISFKNKMLRLPRVILVNNRTHMDVNYTSENIVY